MPVLLGVTLTRFLAMWHYAAHRRIYPGFRTLVFAELAVIAALVVAWVRAMTGELAVLVLLTSVVSLGHPMMVYHGFGQYARMPKLRRRTAENLALTGAVCLYMAVNLLFFQDIALRVLVYSLAAGALTLRTAVELPLKCSRPLPGLRLLCASNLLVAGVHLVRGFEIMGRLPYDYTVMMYTDHLLGTYVLMRILLSVLEMYVVFSMNSAMLEDDLLTATAQIERMAQTDALTGVANRRGLELLGEQVLRRSFGMGRPAAVVMLDLDHFKRVNDSLGHAAGDELLRAVSALCVDSLRKEDVFARYGGEEFVVVAPSTFATQAEMLAERMRRRIEAERFEATGGEPVTASFGVVCAVSGSLEQLLKRADAALYEAKQTGRNKVVVAELISGEENEARLARG
jgi:diguanylate cyclase (GGDEF)-like protein